MKQTFIILIALAAIYFTGCAKNGLPSAVTGSVNGIPATTLYGTSNNASDYILLVKGTTAADKIMSYIGQTYTYVPGAGNIIYIMVSNTYVQHATLDTTGSKTILTIDTNAAHNVFVSTQYSSR